MDIREYFLEVVAEAKLPSLERGAILHSCNIPYDWFNGKKPRYKNFEEVIDMMDEEQLKLELALFIANCYRQR